MYLVFCVHLYIVLSVFIAITMNEPLGMWDWVRKYHCGKQWLSLEFLWLGGPFWLARLESVGKRKQVSLCTSDPSHQTAATFQRQPFSKTEGVRKGGRVTENQMAFFFPREELGFSIPGIATGLQQSILYPVCWESEWPQCVWGSQVPVCPAKGEQPALPAHIRSLGHQLSLRPQPLSQTLGCLRRHCWATTHARPLLKMHSKK